MTNKREEREREMIFIIQKLIADIKEQAYKEAVSSYFIAQIERLEDLISLMSMETQSKIIERKEVILCQ
jgi:hypothetical protein